MKVTYNGQDRYAVRSANYPEAPELGTIVGPTALDEYMTIVKVEGNKAWFAFSKDQDKEDALKRSPQSMTELRAFIRTQFLFREN